MVSAARIFLRLLCAVALSGCEENVSQVLPDSSRSELGAADLRRSEGALVDRGALDGARADGLAPDSLGLDGPKPDGPKPDGPMSDAAKPDAAKADGPKPDAAKPDGPKPDGPKGDAACLVPCASGTFDHCFGGLCRCGNGPACGNGLNCVGGQCGCIGGPTSLCLGCCAPLGNVCVPFASQSLLVCGPHGSVCTSCSDAKQCTVDTCNPSTHTCSNLPASGATCDDAKHCTVNDQCGTSGLCQGAPRDCATPLGHPDDCKVACNELQQCHELPITRPDGSSCVRYAAPAGAGQCQNGACCTGCRTGINACAPGNTLLLCGALGAACQNCLAPYDLGCINQGASACSGGGCNVVLHANGTPCGAGLSKCCKGICQLAPCN